MISSLVVTVLVLTVCATAAGGIGFLLWLVFAGASEDDSTFQDMPAKPLQSETVDGTFASQLERH